MQNLRYFLTVIAGAFSAVALAVIFPSLIPVHAPVQEVLGAPETQVTFQKNLIPITDSTYTLGTTSKTWLNLYTDEICLAGDCQTAWPAGSGSGDGVSNWLFDGTNLTPSTTPVGIVVNGTSTVANLNGVLVVDGVVFPKTGAGIQSALTACSDSGVCGRVHVPAGTYEVSSSIRIKSNIVLSGDGALTVLRLADSTNADVLENFDQTNGNINIVVRDLKIDGNGTNNVTTGRGIHFKETASSTITGVVVANTRTMGIQLEGDSDALKNSRGNKVIGNIVTGVLSTSNDGIYVIRGMDSIFSDNISQGNGRYGIHINRSQNNVVERNVANANTTAGIEIFNSSSTVVMGNQASRNGSNGIRIESNANNASNYNIISNNTIVANASYGLLGGISAGSYVNSYNTYQGNVIADNGDDGLVVFNNPYSVVSGNIVKNNADQGIPVDNSTDSIISDNYVEGNSEEGIEVKNGSKNVVVTNNIVKNNGIVGTGGQTQGIRIETGITGAFVSGNRVFDNQATKTQSYGIQVDSGASNNYIGFNHLEGNATGNFLDSSSGANLISTISATTSALFTSFFGSVAIGTTTPTSNLHLWTSATTTFSIDSNSASKGGCLEIKDRSGVGYTYITAEDGVLTASTVSCK